MKHACIAVGSLSTHGGAERVVCEQARGFSERDVEVTLLVGDYEESVARDYGVPETVSVVETKGSFIGDVRATRRLIQNRDIDIFFTHSFKKRVYLATRPFGDSTPYIPHVHGTILWFVDSPDRLPHMDSSGYQDLIEEVPGHGEQYAHPDQSLSVRASSSVNQWLEKLALRKATNITTGSNRVQHELQILYDVDSTIVRPGVSQDWIDQYSTIEERHLSDHEHTVLTVSRLDPRKRVDVLVEATAALRERGHDVGLVVAGTGEQREDLEQLVTKRGIESAVTFAGFVPEEDLAPYYKSADVFACPGWMSYGITPLEAYSMHTPVGISTDAFVHEVLGDEPGVEIVYPTVEDWVTALPKLFDVDRTKLKPDPIPTWGDFTEEMFLLGKEQTVSKHSSRKEKV